MIMNEAIPNAFFKVGNKQDLDSLTPAVLQQAHLKNIIRFAEERKLIVAGPFPDAGEVRGIYIFNVATLEEARQLTVTDPSIQQGVLEMELRSI